MTGALAVETDPAYRKILRARAGLIVTQPFWGFLAMQLKVAPCADFKTMATDGESLFYDSKFVLGLSDPELRGVIAHEVEHVARCHHTRRGRRNPRKWNHACDYAINPGMLAGKFKLPAGVLNKPEFAGMSAERIYAKLPAGAPQGGAGQGAGFGEVMDAPGGPAAMEEAEHKAQQMVRQAAMVAKAMGAGNLPAGIEELLADLAKPRVDWRGRLSRFADESALREISWNRPNPRYADLDFFLPGSESSAPSHLVLGIDTSGSMSNDALRAIGGHLQAMMDQDAAERLTVVYFDTIVQRVDHYGAGDPFTLNAKGRGGTLFKPFFDWTEREAPDASAVMVLTDMGAFDWSSLTLPPFPVLWASTAGAHPVPFGELVEIDAHS